MVKRNKIPVAANIVCIGLALAAAAAVFYFNSYSPRIRSNATCRIIRRALDCYAAKHTGEYPQSSKITGAGSNKDILIREKCISRYPKNNYAGGRAVKNTPLNAFSPGDFSYVRSNKKGYEFRLLVFGKDAHGGPRRNGIACDLSVN